MTLQTIGNLCGKFAISQSSTTGEYAKLKAGIFAC